MVHSVPYHLTKIMNGCQGCLQNHNQRRIEAKTNIALSFSPRFS
jgi:hypothetical protein